MVTSVAELIEALEAFKPEDGDTANVARLYDLLENFDELPNKALAAGAMFSLIERHPEAEFGSPGPLVHALECISGYEPLLEQSLMRQPTDLTVWMANRIINAATDTGQRQRWISNLRATLIHPSMQQHVRESAEGFIEYQEGD